MNPTISVLHATFGRPEKALSAMRFWLRHAAHPEQIEYVFVINQDDPTAETLAEALIGQPAKVVVGMFKGSAAAWDAAARASTAGLLVQASDDMEPPANWDMQLTERITVDMTKPIFIAVSDGFRRDRLCTTAIMNRARYEQAGEFLHAGYLSVYSDDDVTYAVYRDAKAGKCTVIEARDIVFYHRHHYHDKSVPMDATYTRQNSSEAYHTGALLFNQRNPHAHFDGIKTW